jgi:hypothetical protein
MAAFVFRFDFPMVGQVLDAVAPSTRDLSCRFLRFSFALPFGLTFAASSYIYRVVFQNILRMGIWARPWPSYTRCLVTTQTPDLDFSMILPSVSGGYGTHLHQ